MLDSKRLMEGTDWSAGGLSKAGLLQKRYKSVPSSKELAQHVMAQILKKLK